MYYMIRMAMLAAVIAVTACASRPVPPITAPQTGVWDPGQLIWADLLTDDPAAARTFYTDVFGWQFVGTGDDEYFQATNEGRPVAGIAYHEPLDPKVSEVLWLVSVSVEDVDAAAGAVGDAGGEVLESPRTVPDRGRFAVVADDQGAVLVLLRASGGDPVRQRVVDNEWIWAELWTRDSGQAARFYAKTLGYEQKVIDEPNGEGYLVLLKGGKPKTGIVQLPWDNVTPNWLPYLRVADLTATVARVRSAGGSVLLAPSMAFDEGRVAIVSDPTGGAFAIQARRAVQ